MAEIVKKADHLNREESVELVRLSAVYGGQSIEEQYASINGSYITLRKVSSEVEPQIWHLNGEELEGLYQAYQTYHTERQAALETKEQEYQARVQALLEECMTLAKKHSIEIKKDESSAGHHGWHLHCEAYHQHWSNCTYAYDPDDLKRTIDHMVRSITIKR